MEIELIKSYLSIPQEDREKIINTFLKNISKNIEIKRFEQKSKTIENNNLNSNTNKINFNNTALYITRNY